jgi:glutathione S-transferase
MKIVIGNKRVSSWSLRPWVVLKHFGISFEEILILLDQPDTKKNILKYSPSGFVPALIDGDLMIHDSLAIFEYLNEKFPEKKMWPVDIKARAQARSVTAEMHSGFSTLRRICSHDLQKNLVNFDYSEAKADIDRIQTIWKQCLSQFGGPFLFGKEFCLADAMYAPVVNRFLSYGIKYDSSLENFIQAIRSLPAHQEWIQAGLLEKFDLPFHS